MIIQLRIVLEDHEGETHMKGVIKIEDDATIFQLMDKIHKAVLIEQRFQLLYVNGEQLLLDTTGIEDRGTIVVKHRLLDNWATYQNLMEMVAQNKETGQSNLRKHMVNCARIHLPILNKENFFLTYKKFYLRHMELEEDIHFHIHNTEHRLKRAIEEHFNLILNEGQKLEIERPKQGAGAQFGVFVFVKDASDEPISSYYAKTIGSLPEEEFDPDWKPDVNLAELFVYHLLRIIGIGPSEVHIIDGLRPGCVYVATKLISNLITASGNTVDRMLGRSTADKKQISIDGELIKQMEMLASLLCLEDLIKNKGNYGVVERLPTEVERFEGKQGPIQELRIVDFQVNPALGSRISKSKEEVLNLEKYFHEWNMLSSIEEARKLIENDETIKNNIEVLNKDHFDSYFTQIKKTLQDFMDNPRKTKAE